MELHQTPAEKLYLELAERKGVLTVFHMDFHRGRTSQTIYLIVKQKTKNTTHYDHHKPTVNTRRTTRKKAKGSP